LAARRKDSATPRRGSWRLLRQKQSGFAASLELAVSQLESHGPWTLVEAGVVRGRTLTSYPSVRTDIRNAGGNVVDQEVVTDQNITSSRWPDDLPAFCARIVEQFAAGWTDRPGG
jgi:DJ-1/PfpI family